MIVDEDKPLGESLASFFKKKGYLTKAIQESETAVLELAQRHYHIVVLSLEMPAIGGVPLFARIRKFDPDIVVIATTAEPSVVWAVASLKQGAFDYLMKPFPLEALQESVDRAIQAKGLLTDIEERLRVEIGQRVRELRRAKGLTLKQVASRAHHSLSLISQIEHGRCAASLSTLYKIATALGVTLSSFFEGMSR